jgi:hypothetical protein
MPQEQSHGNITLLVCAGTDPGEALQDWARGPGWVRWMFTSIHSRLDTLHARGPAPDSAPALDLAWRQYCLELFIPSLAPLLGAMSAAAAAGHTRRLRQLATRLHECLPVQAREHGETAGRALLSATRGALHQGILGKHRAAVEEETCPAQFLPVWAALGSLFHVGQAGLISQYLSLEWEMLSRHCPEAPRPAGEFSLNTLTRLALQSTTPAVLPAWSLARQP